jgi:hypothetical protein
MENGDRGAQLSSNVLFLDYQKMTKGIVEEPDDEIFWHEVYEKVIELFPEYDECPFPVGLDEITTRSIPTHVQVGNMSILSPVLTALIKKVVTGYEEAKRTRWVARRNDATARGNGKEEAPSV